MVPAEPHLHLGVADVPEEDLVGPDATGFAGADAMFDKVQHDPEITKDYVTKLLPEENDHNMVQLMNVLEAHGVTAERACTYASTFDRGHTLVKRLYDQLDTNQRLVAATCESKPTLMEIDGGAAGPSTVQALALRV